MSWFRGSKNLTHVSDKYSISQDGCLFVLEIPTVHATDAGLYTLHALSSSGNKRSVSFVLNVIVDEGTETIDMAKLVASLEVSVVCLDS